MAECIFIGEWSRQSGAKEAHLEISDSTNAQRFHEQWNLVNSRSDGSNVPRSMDPYVSNYTLAQYRT